MIRYYGAYSRKTKKIYSGYLQRSITQTTFDNFIKNPNKWAPFCPKCGNKMIFDRYEKEPPKENEALGNKLPDWSHPMLSHCYN